MSTPNVVRSLLAFSVVVVVVDVGINNERFVCVAVRGLNANVVGRVDIIRHHYTAAAVAATDC